MTTIVGTPVGTLATSNITGADVMFMVARNLGLVVTGTADSGSTSTVVDTDRTEEDDYWNEMALWRVDAPYEVTKVTDFAASSDTVTHAVMSVTMSGKKYAIARPPLRYEELWLAVNQALLEHPPVLSWYVASANAATQRLQVSADIAAGFIEAYYGADDTEWIKAINPKVKQLGVNYYIDFPHGLAENVRIMYKGPCAQLTAPTEYLHFMVDAKLISALATVAMLFGLKTRFQNDYWDDHIKRWSSLAGQYLAEHRPPITQRSGQIFYGPMS